MAFALPAGLSPVAASEPTGVALSAERLVGRIVFGQVPVGDTRRSTDSPHERAAAPTLPNRSRVVSLDLASQSAGLTNLTPSFAAAGRPEVSFDGKRVLFVGRPSPDDRLGVWEMSVEGGPARRVTDTAVDCLQATYLSTIYSMSLDKPEEHIAFTGRGEGWSPAALYICRLDGSNLQRITFSPFDTTDPWLISDGRLLFSHWSPAAFPTPSGLTDQIGGRFRPAKATSALFTVYPDGTDLFPFAAVHEQPAARAMPCEMPDGSIVYVESQGQGGRLGGALVSVHRTRSLHSRRVIADDTVGRYHSPSPFSENQLLVSFRGADQNSYGIFLLDTGTGRRLRAVYDDPQWHDVRARLIQPRPEPAGRSSVVDAQKRFGEVYCLDAYISDEAHVRRVDRGRIDRVRIIQALTAGREACGASGRESTSVGSAVRTGDLERECGEMPTGTGEVTLAEVPVESDGSFFLAVPARTPLRLETLDSDGTMLRAMKSWFWVMPGERRGCIGCHEDRELTPLNRLVSALRKAPHKVEVAASFRPGPGGRQ